MSCRPPLRCRLVAALWALAAASGCSAAEDAKSPLAEDTRTSFPDATVPQDVVLPADTATDTALGADLLGEDAASADSAAPTDAVGPPPDEGPSVDASGLTALKPEPGWIVPGGVVARTAVALAGARVAWVEAPEDAPHELVVWDLALPGSAPRTYRPANLAHPRELALGDAVLVYVDDRYGDPDLFALDLATGSERALVARPGAQDRPAVDGSRVAWSDCRACVGGDGGAGREIYRGALPPAALAEERVTADALADDAAAWGELEDGGAALAWVSGSTRLRVRGESGLEATLDAPAPVRAVALTAGALAFRQAPTIINPDSMLPSDVRVWTVGTGAVTSLTFHAELAPGVDGAPRAAAGRLAWLEAVPGDAALSAVRVTDVTGGAVLEAEVAGAATLALSGSHLAVLAPRDDNGGRLDLWIRELP